jgi:hypothetical protein
MLNLLFPSEPGPRVPSEPGRPAFESITSFGWSGSAVLGGLLIDHSGYRAALGATAALQLVALSLLAPLPALVPRGANGGGGLKGFRGGWRRAKWARRAAEPLLATS